MSKQNNGKSAKRNPWENMSEAAKHELAQVFIEALFPPRRRVNSEGVTK